MPLMFTSPLANQMMGPVSTFDVSLTVTPEAMVIVVKWKILSPAGFNGGVNLVGSKVTVPGVVRFSAPSAPVDPLLKV